MFFNKTINILFSILTGILLSLSFAPFSFHFLQWFSIVPLLLVILNDKKTINSFYLSLLSGIIFYSISLSWMFKIFSFKGFVFWFIFSLWFALFFLILKKFYIEINKFKNSYFFIFLFIILSSFFWVGIEYFRAEKWLLSCPWLVLGYAQNKNLIFYQSLSFFGVFGMSFLIIFINLSIAISIYKKKKLFLIISIIILILIYSYGSYHLNKDDKFNKEIKVALIQNESEDFNELLTMTNSLKNKGIDLIVWPENSFYLKEPKDLNSYLNILREKLKGLKSYLVLSIGIKENKDIKKENFAIVLDEDKNIIYRYDKMHPVPFIEKGLKAHKPEEILKTNLGNFAIQICYDLNFENGSRIFTEKNANLIIAPTNDPLYWGAKQQIQHSDMSSARAIENSLWIIRPATSGISQIINSKGKIKSKLETGKKDIIIEKIKLKNGRTFYSKYGYLFLYFSMIITFLFILFIITKSIFKIY